MPNIPAPGKTLDHQRRLGTAGRFTAADPARRLTSRQAHRTDESAASPVAAGALGEVRRDGASS